VCQDLGGGVRVFRCKQMRDLNNMQIKSCLELLIYVLSWLELFCLKSWPFVAFNGLSGNVDSWTLSSGPFTMAHASKQKVQGKSGWDVGSEGFVTKGKNGSPVAT